MPNKNIWLLFDSTIIIDFKRKRKQMSSKLNLTNWKWQLTQYQSHNNLFLLSQHTIHTIEVIYIEWTDDKTYRYPIEEACCVLFHRAQTFIYSQTNSFPLLNTRLIQTIWYECVFQVFLIHTNVIWVTIKSTIEDAPNTLAQSKRRSKPYDTGKIHILFTNKIVSICNRQMILLIAYEQNSKEWHMHSHTHTTIQIWGIHQFK